MMLFHLPSVLPSGVITYSAPSCHRSNASTNHYKSTDMIEKFIETLEPEIISSPNHDMFLWQAGRMGNINSPQRLSWYLLIAYLLFWQVHLCSGFTFWMLWGISPDIDWRLISDFYLSWICVICNSKGAPCRAMLPLRADWGKAPPVPNPQMWEE